MSKNAQRKTFFLQAFEKAQIEGFLSPADVLRHATPELLAQHMPRAVWAKLLTSLMGARSSDASSVVQTLDLPIIVESIPDAILYALLTDIVERSLTANGEVRISVATPNSPLPAPESDAIAVRPVAEAVEAVKPEPPAAVELPASPASPASLETNDIEVADEPGLTGFAAMLGIEDEVDDIPSRPSNRDMSASVSSHSHKSNETLPPDVRGADDVTGFSSAANESYERSRSDSHEQPALVASPSDMAPISASDLDRPSLYETSGESTVAPNSLSAPPLSRQVVAPRPSAQWSRTSASSTIPPAMRRPQSPASVPTISPTTTMRTKPPSVEIRTPAMAEVDLDLGEERIDAEELVDWNPAESTVSIDQKRGR